MKQLPITAGIALFIGLSAACNNNSTAPKESTEQPKQIAATETESLDAVGLGNFYIDVKDAEKYIKHFRKMFRKNDKDDSLSRSVWFSKEMIKVLNAKLQEDSLNLDGVRIYLAAYDHKIAGTNAKYKNQVTLILVPTNDSSGYHKDNWNIFTKSMNKSLMDGLNHGDLCPDKCKGSDF